jgi:hypothetical protein
MKRSVAVLGMLASPGRSIYVQCDVVDPFR